MSEIKSSYKFKKLCYKPTVGCSTYVSKEIWQYDLPIASSEFTFNSGNKNIINFWNLKNIEAFDEMKQTNENCIHYFAKITPYTINMVNMGQTDSGHLPLVNDSEIVLCPHYHFNIE